MDFTNNSDWKVTRVLLSAVGLWPFQSSFHRKVLSSVTLILLDGMFIFEVLKIMKSFNDLNEVMIALPMTSLHVVVNIKIINYILHIPTMKLFLTHIQRDWQTEIYRSSEGLLHNEQSIERQMLDIYMYSLFGATSMYLIMPTVPVVLDYIIPLNESRPRVIMYRAEYFFDAEKYTVPIVIHSYIITLIPATVFVGVDSMFANAVEHACNMFEIVGNRLKFLISNASRQVGLKTSPIRQTEIRMALNDCIRMHKEILQFIDLVEASYSFSFFIMTTMSLAVTSLSWYQVLVSFDDLTEITRVFGFMIAQFFHLLFRCWFGQKLTNYSEIICESLYQCKWYDIPSSSRKLLVVIIMRGHKKSQITAGNVFPMSLEHFGAVMKSSISFLAVLRTVQ